MPNWTALHAELALPEYSGMSDADAAAHYNEKTIAVRVQSVPISAILIWAGSGPMDAIEAGQAFTNADAPTQKAVRAACKAAMRIFGAIDSFDLDSGTNRAMLGMFVQIGIITSAEEASLLAIGDQTQPLSIQPDRFGSTVTASDVHAARN